MGSSCYNFEKEEKLEIDTRTLEFTVEGRVALAEIKNEFSIKKLQKCREGFQAYVDKYGDGEHEPVQITTPWLTWLNKPANVIAPYSHFIHTNQKYASQAISIIDKATSIAVKVDEIDKESKATKTRTRLYEQLTNCEILILPSTPKKNELDKLPIHSNAAYIRSGNRLFYANRLLDELTTINLNTAALAKFDKKINASDIPRVLSESQLKEITIITEHIALLKPVQIHAKAVFNAILAIKQIDETMGKKNITGIVRDNIHATLKEFGLDKKNKELQQRIEEIEYSINNLNKLFRKRVMSPVLIEQTCLQSIKMN